MVEVRPGELRKFADHVEDLWEQLEPLKKALAESKSTPTYYNYPEFGELNEAPGLKGKYDTKLAEMIGAVDKLYQMLEGVRDGSRNIADNYESTEALNQASVDQVDSLLGQEMGPATPPTA